MPASYPINPDDVVSTVTGEPVHIELLGDEDLGSAGVEVCLERGAEIHLAVYCEKGPLSIERIELEGGDLRIQLGKDWNRA